MEQKANDGKQCVVPRKMAASLLRRHQTGRFPCENAHRCTELATGKAKIASLDKNSWMTEARERQGIASRGRSTWSTLNCRRGISIWNCICSFIYLWEDWETTFRIGPCFVVLPLSWREGCSGLFWVAGVHSVATRGWPVLGAASEGAANVPHYSCTDSQGLHICTAAIAIALPLFPGS